MKNSTKFVWIVLGAIAALLIVLTVIVRLMIADHLVVVEEGENYSFNSGPTLTEHYNMEDFSAIKITGGWDVTVTEGDDFNLSVEFKEAAREKMHIEKKEDTLYLTQDFSKRGNMSDVHGAKVTITMPALEAVTVEGAVNLNLKGFAGEVLDFRLDGAGQIVGRDCSYDRLNVESSGAVNLDFTESLTRNADVDLEGAGNVMIRMDGGTLSGSLSGLARLGYSGDVSSMTVKKDGIAGIEYIQK